MKIAILVEGATEKALMPSLRRFLNSRLPGKMPRLKPIPDHGTINVEAIRESPLHLCGYQNLHQSCFL